MNELVMVVVPNDSSVVITAEGKAYPVTVDTNGRRVWLPVADARTLISSGAPSCVAWTDANPRLAEALGRRPETKDDFNR